MIYGVEIQDILKNIFSNVKGYRKGEQIKICCPECQDRDGLLYPDGKFNLEINTKINSFHCWKCDMPKFSGSIGKLIKKYGTNYDYKLYRSYSRLYYNGYTPNSKLEDEDYVYNIKLPEGFIYFSDIDFKNTKHLEFYNYWVLDRKLTFEIAKHYNVGFCIDGEFKDRIIVPSYDKFGDINYLLGRYIGKDKKTPKYKNIEQDKEKIIFNESNINWDSTVFIVEGVFDMFSVPKNTIPLLGKRMYPLLYDKIKEKKPNIILCLDPDAIKSSIDIYRELLSIYGYESNNKIRIAVIDNDLDIDEIRKVYGERKVADIIRNSIELDLSIL